MKKIFLFLLFVIPICLKAKDFDVSASKRFFFNRTLSPQFISKIVDTTQTEEEKVWAIYTFITHNIKYDVRSLEKGTFGKKQSAKKVIWKRKAVCAGYANLFTEMCRLAGIKSEVVVGYNKGIMYDPKVPFFISEHAWSVARIDSSWIIVEPTFGSGYVDIKKQKLFTKICDMLGIPIIHDKLKFYQSPNPEFYDVDPEKFTLTHLSENTFFQLLKCPVSILDFDEGDSAVEFHFHKTLTDTCYDYFSQIQNINSTEGIGKQVLLGDNALIHNERNFATKADAYTQKCVANYKYLSSDSFENADIIQIEHLIKLITVAQKDNIDFAAKMKEEYVYLEKSRNEHHRVFMSQNRKEATRITKDMQSLRLQVRLKKESTRRLRISVHSKLLLFAMKNKDGLKVRRPQKQKETDLAKIKLFELQIKENNEKRDQQKGYIDSLTQQIDLYQGEIENYLDSINDAEATVSMIMKRNNELNRDLELLEVLEPGFTIVEAEVEEMKMINQEMKALGRNELSPLIRQRSKMYKTNYKLMNDNMKILKKIKRISYQDRKEEEQFLKYKDILSIEYSNVLKTTLETARKNQALYLAYQARLKLDKKESRIIRIQRRTQNKRDQKKKKANLTRLQMFTELSKSNQELLNLLDKSLKKVLLKKRKR